MIVYDLKRISNMHEKIIAVYHNAGKKKRNTLWTWWM